MKFLVPQKWRDDNVTISLRAWGENRRLEGHCFLSNKPPHKCGLVLVIRSVCLFIYSYCHYNVKGAFPVASSILHVLLLACKTESS